MVDAYSIVQIVDNDAVLCVYCTRLNLDTMISLSLCMSTVHIAVLYVMQVLMFSATLHSQEVKDVASKICQQPIVVDLKVRKCMTSEQLLLSNSLCNSHLGGCKLLLLSLCSTLPVDL